MIIISLMDGITTVYIRNVEHNEKIVLATVKT